MAPVTVEFFGIPRLRAGTALLEVEGATLGAALADLARRCPALVPEVLDTRGALTPHYRLALDGARFLTDPAEPLPPGARLVLLSADAGG